MQVLMQQAEKTRLRQVGRTLDGFETAIVRIARRFASG